MKSTLTVWQSEIDVNALINGIKNQADRIKTPLTIWQYELI
jgi:hypothetical protein